MSITAEAQGWLDLAETLASEQRQEGESFAQAFARVTKSGAAAHAIEMHRAAQGRKPPAMPALTKGAAQQAAEAELHRLAVVKARDDGRSYEQAMAELLATPEGKNLWTKARA